MKKWIFSLLALSASSALAAPESYSIKSDLTINGTHVTTAKIIAQANEQATVIQKNPDGHETFIAVTPSEGQGEIKGRKAILMKFVVGVIEKGERKILGEPQIMTLENNKAEISVSRSAQHSEDFSLSVIVERN